MKVCFLDDIKPLGAEGSSVHRWELLKGLLKANVEGHIIVNKKVQLDNLKVHNSKRSAIAFPISILKLNRRYLYDFLYSRNIPYGFLGILISKIQQSKFILELNGIPEDEMEIYKKYNLKQDLKNKIKSHVILKLSKFVYKFSNGILVVTPLIKNYLTTKGISKNKIKVIQNGVNPNIFSINENLIKIDKLRKKHSISKNEKIVVYIGSLVPWQGVEYLIDASSEVIINDPNVRFIIVGDGMLKKLLMEKVKKLGLIKNYLFVGKVPYEEVPNYIHLSDVCILLKQKIKSGYSPLKLYEYMASGRPIIATDTHGFEILNEIKAGILVDPKNSKEVSNAIIKLISNEKICKEFGKNGYEYISENHTWDMVSVKTKNFLQKILGESN